MEKVQLEGFFLSFSPGELKEVREELSRLGYQADSIGMKSFLLDALYGTETPAESDTERIVRKARQFIGDRPEVIRAGVNVAYNIMEIIKNARKNTGR